MGTTSSNNQMALYSAITAAVTWLLFGCGLCFSFGIPPFAICTAALFLLGNAGAAFTGWRGRQQIAESAGAEGGDSLALGGLVAGGVGIVLALLALVAAIILTAIGGAAVLNQ